MPEMGSVPPHNPSSQLAGLLRDGSIRAQSPFPVESGTVCLCAVRASGRTLLLTPSSNLVLRPGHSSDRALLLDRDCLWGKGRHEGQYGAWASQRSGPLSMFGKPHPSSPGSSVLNQSSPPLPWPCDCVW